MRGYVWRGKFYGTVITPEDTLHVEPLAHTSPVNTRSGILSPSCFISSYYFLKTGEEQVGERLRVQSVQQAAILQQVQQQGQEEETRVQDDTAAETLQVRGGRPEMEL